MAATTPAKSVITPPVKAKEVTKVTGTPEKGEPIQNDNLDNHPPGSASVVERGVPQRRINEAKQGGTTQRPPAMQAAAPPDAQVIQTMPYKAPNPLAEARQTVRAQMKVGDVDSRQRARSVGRGKPVLSAKSLAHLMRTIDGVDAGTAAELNSVLDILEVDDLTRREVRELMKNPQLFSGDQKPANLQVLSLPPGAQKPPEFDTAPGTNSIPDTRYYPTRYATIPKEDNFEDGDLIYNVHEDASYTVLSVYQQTSDWQSNHHTPPMNLIKRIGGSADDIPRAVSNSQIVNRKEETEEATGKK